LTSSRASYEKFGFTAFGVDQQRNWLILKTEAKFFPKYCPGAKMDGNHDGTPWEQQWCISPFTKYAAPRETKAGRAPER
jgi:hypothetical protein